MSQKLLSFSKVIVPLFFYRKLTEKLFPEDPWNLFYAHGFSDSPVAWKNAENNFFTNSENAFALFLKSDGKYLQCIQKTSNKRLRT